MDIPGGSAPFFTLNENMYPTLHAGITMSIWEIYYLTEREYLGNMRRGYAMNPRFAFNGNEIFMQCRQWLKTEHKEKERVVFNLQFREGWKTLILSDKCKCKQSKAHYAVNSVNSPFQQLGPDHPSGGALLCGISSIGSFVIKVRGLMHIKTGFH